VTDAVTLDRFLNGRITVAQPKNGFRAGHDSVLLAAAVAVDPGSRVLELGSGAGVASLCLAARVPGVAILGVEIDPDLVRLANDNALRNNVSDRVSFVLGDAGAPSDSGTFFPPPPAGRGPISDSGAVAGPSVSRSDGGGLFDHIFFNPPFHPDSAHRSPVTARDRATRDSTDAVRTWTGRALSLVRDAGTVTAIVRADRVDDVLDRAADYGAFVLPLLPRAGLEPKRAIVRIVKVSDRNVLHLPGLVLHESDGRNTQTAEAILRYAKPLNLAP
jgi:tRNA1(Val) A37 N6-methylase TrmN6